MLYCITKHLKNLERSMDRMNDIFFNNITHGGFVFIEMMNMIKEMKSKKINNINILIYLYHIY